MEEELLRELEELRRRGLYRRRFLPEGLKVLCSNNYLNLSNRREVKEAALRAVETYGTGSGASQLVSGYTELHRSLEEELAKAKGVPACLTVGSGYLANLAVITALVSEGDLVLSDELNHASIVDGVRLSKAAKFVYPHRDAKAARLFLEKRRGGFRRCLIVTDGVFSMDGDLAPLPELVELAERFDCFLVVDDAHATGTVGLSSLAYWGLEWKPFVVEVGTLSKALGSYGAFVCGSETLVEYLVNKARPVIFSTSLPPPSVAAAEAALRVLLAEPSLVERLQNLSREVKKRLRAEGFDLGPAEEFTPIVPLLVGEEERALGLRDRLLERGFFVQAIRYPTVPRGKARLRLTVTLEHPPEVYAAFVQTLVEIWK
ncbi:MAG: 8-amino-7-oxononanoate synthase [Aquificae bacterium]|nr:8-amino-7-oxononanoate synthase [Aquificota bacterium]